MSTVLLILIVAVMVAAMILTLFLGIGTGFFTAKIPGGADAMGLIVPLGTIVAAWVLTVLGAWLCVGRGGFDWISPTKLVPFAVVTLLVVGVGLAAGGTFALWLDKVEGVWWAGTLGAVALPLALQAVILMCAWKGESLSAASFARVAGYAFLPVALIGYGFGGLGLVTWERRAAENARRANASRVAEAAERSRRGSLSTAERVVEDYRAFSEDAPLWSVAGYLVDTQDPEVVKVVVDRVRRVRGLDEQLHGTLTAKWASIRGIALEYVRVEERRKAEWATWVEESILMLAAEIRAAGTLDNESRQEKIPAEVARAAGVAREFAGFDFAPCLKELRAAVEACPGDERRDVALGRIDGALGTR